MDYLSLMPFLKAAAGGALGYGYYKIIGCRSGACPITSSPVASTLYGMVVGFIV